MELARDGRTTHPVLSKILLARAINRALGGGVVAPWDLESLPEDILDALVAFVRDLPDLQRSFREAEEAFARWRAQHPTYRRPAAAGR